MDGVGGWQSIGRVRLDMTGTLQGPLVCGSEDEAIEKAKRLLDDYDIELWSGERFIVRLERKLNQP
jgi:hypothetical protein